MPNRFARHAAIGVVVLAVGSACAASVAEKPQAPDSQTRKADRTAAQQKIDSRLLREIDRRRADAARGGAPPADAGIKFDETGRALVDVRVEVTPAMREKIAALKGTIVSDSEEHRSIVAWMPLLQLETLAEDPAVRAIVPPSGATTNKP
jgi:hypothetical protein